MSIIKHSSPLLGTVSFSNYTGSLECGDGLVQKLIWKLWQTRCKRLLCIYIYVMLLELELQKISLKGGIFGHGSSLHIVCLFSIVFTNLPTLNNAIPFRYSHKSISKPVFCGGSTQSCHHHLRRSTILLHLPYLWSLRIYSFRILHMTCWFRQGSVKDNHHPGGCPGLCKLKSDVRCKIPVPPPRSQMSPPCPLRGIHSRHCCRSCTIFRIYALYLHHKWNKQRSVVPSYFRDLDECVVNQSRRT